MLNLKNKIKKLIRNETNVKDEIVTVHQENNVKGYIDYTSGLWINGWVAGADTELPVSEEGYSNCTVKVNDQEVLKFSANIVRTDLQAIPELKNGLGFDVQMPVQKLAKLITDVDSLEFSIHLDGSKIPHSIVVSKEEFYQKAFDNLYEDINCYIANLPLFTEESIHLLNNRQKLFLLTSILDAGISDELKSLMALLAYELDLTSEEMESSLDLIGRLNNSIKFLGLFLRTNQDILSGLNISKVINNTLRAMPYLESKDLIMSNITSEAVRDELLLNCTSLEEKKFEFIESFPLDIENGLLQWESLSQNEKRDYWPLLAGMLQFSGRQEDLKFISTDPAWYLSKIEPGQSKEDILKAAINDSNNQWFAMSFIVLATVTGRKPAFIANLLKEFSWKAWDINYFDTDSFSYISNNVLEQQVSIETYRDICEAFSNVISFAAEHDKDTLHRKVFVSALIKVINYGIVNQYSNFSALEETARPYLCLTNTFSNGLEISPLKYTNYNQYLWLSEFYRKTKKVRDFFLNFKAAGLYSNIELVEVLEQLLHLKRAHFIQNIDPRLLSLSRYCQLTEREELFPLLKSIHAEMGDYYTALQLETDVTERNALTQRITEFGDKSKRSDAYWFVEVLQARLDKTGAATLDLLRKLHFYLQCSLPSPQGINLDLTELLISEIIWLCKQKIPVGDLPSEIQLIAEEFAEESYHALKLYIALTDESLLQKPTIEFLNTIEGVLGAEALYNTIDTLEFTTARVHEKSERALLSERIEQNYIYPYIRVLVYSCNKYEDTRHKIIRNTWLKDLAAYGIDYSIVVGDAEESHMEGDKMCLQVRDTYEELPQKSLSMFDFASRDSYHRYYYKIDDDCILNVKAMFGDPAFLNTKYFGRTVSRPLGGVDRKWHHLKSTTVTAKESLDLSPEMSSYCDGSTGYILNREAITKLTAQVQSPDSVQLISASYFEDKLIGDLMFKAGVEFSNSGYNTVIKRSIASGRDVQIWDYGLLPNSETNIKVLHTEDDDFRLNYYSKLHGAEPEIPELLYRDVTSNMSPVWFSGKEQAPVLEVIRVNESAISTSRVVAIIVGKNEQEFLPNLLEHHRKLGVEHFLFVDNVSSDTSIDYMLEQPDVSVFVATQDYKFSRFGVNWQETLCSHYCVGRWTLIIDSDELFMYDGFENHSIQELLDQADNEGANAIFSPMLDFYPSGALEAADITVNKPFYETCQYFDSIDTMSVLEAETYGPFSNSRVYSAGLRERIFGRYNSYPQPNYLNQKYNLIKYNPSMRLIEGLHFMHGNKKFSSQCGIMHFKYHSGFHKKVMREVESGQHWNGAKEYRRYLDLFEKNKNVQLFDDAVSLKYSNSGDLVNSGYISKISWSNL